ncbi:ATP-binding protein [Streptomyces triticirhizae]|uniref:ATP-binding protein n=1 Tax=Streptomyces triticirhizae TaxID=2483353 RepID=A0A3M2M5N3_9ACTN|nr:ATP-binding protein [Streptomyces triticirhizae]RMI44133.1 ATP-binding protein [Streptomyces triticirhizae]
MLSLAAAATQRSSRPARGELRFRLPAELRAAGQARRRVRFALAAWGVSDETAETVELVISELTANAVRHTESATVDCRLWDAGDRLGVEVTDEHAGSRTPRPRAAGVDEECGRGLALVDALSLRWGVAPARLGIGQRVWAELPHDARENDAAAPAGRGPNRPAEQRF